MFQLDESFLQEIGKSDLPEAEKAAFIEHIQNELEARIGMRMTEGLTKTQIDEFERIIDGDMPTIQNFLSLNTPNYQSDPVYQQFISIGGIDGSPELLGEFTSMKWLEKNRPDYQDIVTKTASEIKSEIIANRDSL
jgi:hypothetical protein